MIHPSLVEKLLETYGDRLAAKPEITLDAIMLRLPGDTIMAVRFANASEYSIRWRWGDAELGVDTAPCHTKVATHPNHFHDDQNIVYPDPFTVPGREPWDNLRVVVDAVLDDPLCTTHVPRQGSA